MTAIPHAAEALTSASGRFEQASARLLEAASGAASADMATPIAQLGAAKTQFKAAIGVIRFSDEMFKALIEIGRET